MEIAQRLVDVDSSNDQTAYTIPADNPLVNTPGARGEIWAYGMRNPWKFSFDPTSATDEFTDFVLQDYEQRNCASLPVPMS